MNRFIDATWNVVYTSCRPVWPETLSDIEICCDKNALKQDSSESRVVIACVDSEGRLRPSRSLLIQDTVRCNNQRIGVQLEIL